MKRYKISNHSRSSQSTSMLEADQAVERRLKLDRQRYVLKGDSQSRDSVDVPVLRRLRCGQGGRGGVSGRCLAGDDRKRRQGKGDGECRTQRSKADHQQPPETARNPTEDAFAPSVSVLGTQREGGPRLRGLAASASTPSFSMAGAK